MKYIKVKLRPYQKEQAAFISKKRRALLCEKTGRGKTLTLLSAFIYLYNQDKVKILFASTPLNAYSKKVWASECDKHTNLRHIDLENLINMSMGSVEKALRILNNFQVVYLKHTHVRKHHEFLYTLLKKTLSVLVVDEVHALKNPRTSLTRFWYYVSSGATALWTLTASPLSKDLEDSYHIINFTRPGSLGTFYSFREIYCTTEEIVIGRVGSKLRKVEKITGFSQPELFDKLISNFVIKGTNEIAPEFHQIPYDMSEKEKLIYRKIASGVAKSEVNTTVETDWIEDLFTTTEDLPSVNKSKEITDEYWLKKLLVESNDEDPYYMKDITRHASRFIYLQYAADGIIDSSGLIGEQHGQKYLKALDVIKEITDRKQSIIIYFSFHASLDVMESLLKKSLPHVQILKSTGKCVLDENAVTEGKVKARPHVILCTKAGTESVSYYFINNVMFFHYPTVPDTFVQFVGRITRLNTLFPNNLHVWMLLKENIDMYKLLVITDKTRQMEQVGGDELNVPDLFKHVSLEGRKLREYKNKLLWNNV